MAASFPTSIKSFTAKTDGVDDVLAAHVNDIQDEITAIETYGGGWTPAGVTFTYASASSFRLTGDQTSVYTRGVRIRLTQTTDKYFYVLSSSYGAPNTTVTVWGYNTYTVANAAITLPYYSRAHCPIGWPFPVNDHVSLTTPLTSTSWDGDGYSTTAKTTIDLSAVFGVPAGIKAIDARCSVEDAAAATGDYYLVLSPNNTAGQGIFFGCIPVNDRYNRTIGRVPCDANGDVFYQTAASGAGTLDVIIQIWGYDL